MNDENNKSMNTCKRIPGVPGFASTKLDIKKVPQKEFGGTSEVISEVSELFTEVLSGTSPKESENGLWHPSPSTSLPYYYNRDYR